MTTSRRAQKRVPRARDAIAKDAWRTVYDSQLDCEDERPESPVYIATLHLEVLLDIRDLLEAAERRAARRKKS